MTSYYCQHDTQRKVTGHKQGPHRSPGAADESGQRRRGQQAHQVRSPETALAVRLPEASELERISLYQLLWGARGQTQSFARPWDKETVATDKVALSQPCPLGFLPADDRALECRAECVFNSSFHSDQLMENRLRRPPRISTDPPGQRGRKVLSRHGPRGRLGHWCRQGSGCCLPDTGTQPGLSDSVFNGVKSTWFVYFSFNLGHFVSLSENVT